MWFRVPGSGFRVPVQSSGFAEKNPEPGTGTLNLEPER
jgi:hypothetical protein